MIKIKKRFYTAIALSFFYALILGGELPYLIMFSLISVFIIDLIYLSIIKRSLSIKIIREQDYFTVGNNVEYITQLNCSSFMPIPYIEIKNKITNQKQDSKLVSITMEENCWIQNREVFNARGIYNLKNYDIIIFDIFQLMKLQIMDSDNTKIKVYPKVITLKERSLGGKDIYLEAHDKNCNNEDSFSIRDVRKYRTGDSLKKVHWKLSAKYGELYVKNSETISGEEAVVFIDMNKDNYSFDELGITEEKVVDMTLSIISLMRQREVKTNLFINAANSENIQIVNKENFDSLIEYMLTLRSNSENKIEDFLQRNIYKLHKVNKIIIVLAVLYDEFINNVIDLKMKGYLISVIYCYKNAYNDEKEKMLSKWGIECVFADSIL